MTFSASWYTQHPSEAVEETDPSIFDNMSRNDFASVVTKAAQSNLDLQADALSKADSWSFQVAHPEFFRTAKNTKLINHWLNTQRITNPTYTDFEAAYQFLSGEGLLEIDAAELAKQQDQKGNRTFKGTLTGREFDSLDTMILQERQAALLKVPETTEAERSLEHLPIETVKTLLRKGERDEWLEANKAQTRNNADAWLTLHPEFVDSEHNARMMKMQLAANGCTDNNVSIEDYEIAANQLRAAELVTLNKVVLTKQHSAEVKQLASEAAQTPGSVFDNTSEEEMENLDMDELRRRANAALVRG